MGADSRISSGFDLMQVLAYRQPRPSIAQQAAKYDHRQYKERIRVNWLEIAVIQGDQPRHRAGQQPQGDDNEQAGKQPAQQAKPEAIIEKGAADESVGRAE